MKLERVEWYKEKKKLFKMYFRLLLQYLKNKEKSKNLHLIFGLHSVFGQALWLLFSFGAFLKTDKQRQNDN